MKETTFIKQNKKKWARFEKVSNKKNSDPDEVARLFTEITEDLSYARTFYPRRSVRVYLNQLAQGVFTSLYRHERKPLGSFWKFWSEKLPLELYRSRWNILVAFLFFSLAVIIGAASQEYDTDFVRMILGDWYVDSTEVRIENGDPMGIYGESTQTSMFFRITLNNIMVAFLAFASGIFISLGTFIILLNNGIMLGSFQWWFKAKGLLLTSILAVWIHGAFEISAIVIAGGAGITLGNGILFPGTYTRVQSLIFSAKRGLLILLSLIPVFIMAGFLESFVTRYYKVMPVWSKVAIIFLSFAIIIFYYVIYPVIVARKNPDKLEVREVPRYIPARKIEWFKIRKIGEVFTDSFFLLVKKFRLYMKSMTIVVFPAALFLAAIVFAVEWSSFDYRLGLGELWEQLFGFSSSFTLYKYLGWSVIFGLLMTNIGFVSQLEEDEFEFTKEYWSYQLKKGVWMIVFAALLLLIMHFIFWYYDFLTRGMYFYQSPAGYWLWCLLIFFFLIVFIAPIPGLIMIGNHNFFSAFGKVFSLLKFYFWRSFGAFSTFFIFALILLGILCNPLGFGNMDVESILTNILELFTITIFDDYAVLTNIMLSGLYFFYFFFIFMILTLIWKFGYTTMEEMTSAKGLYERMEKFGKRNKTFETKEDYE